MTTSNASGPSVEAYVDNLLGIVGNRLENDPCGVPSTLFLAGVYTALIIARNARGNGPSIDLAIDKSYEMAFKHVFGEDAEVRL